MEQSISSSSSSSSLCSRGEGKGQNRLSMESWEDWPLFNYFSLSSSLIRCEWRLWHLVIYLLTYVFLSSMHLNRSHWQWFVLHGSLLDLSIGQGRGELISLFFSPSLLFFGTCPVLLSLSRLFTSSSTTWKQKKETKWEGEGIKLPLFLYNPHPHGSICVLWGLYSPHKYKHAHTPTHIHMMRDEGERERGIKKFLGES